MNHKTGYHVFIGGDRYWHRTLKGARLRARAGSNFHTQNITQIVEVATGDLVWGERR